MNKKQVISLVTISTMLLSGSVGVFADELPVASTEASATTVEAPATVEEESATTTENQPIENESEPSTDDTVDDGVTDGTVIGSDDATVTPPSTDEPSIIDQPAPIEEPKAPTPPTVEPSKETPKETTKQDDEEPMKDKTKEPQGTDDLFIKPIKEPTLKEPIFSDKGDKIVGTQDSQLLVQKSDGTLQTKNATDLGGTVLSDGTVALKDSTGEMKRLPKTGDDALGSFAMAISGVIALFGTAFVKAKSLFR